MYRRRRKISAKLQAAMQAGLERARLAQPAPERAPDLPDLRRTIITIDYDHGHVEHRIDLYRTNRIDLYRAVADGKPWRDRIGWAKTLEALRKSFIRVSACRD